MTSKPAEGPHLLEQPTPNLNPPKRVQAHYCLPRALVAALEG